MRKAEGYFGSGQARIPGRLVLDGIDLLRGAFVRMDDYSLDAVAREVLGEGKAVSGDVRDRIGEIMHNYRHDLPAFALYARTDARLAFRSSSKLNLVAARIRAQPARRHDAGSRRRQHRVVRLPVSHRARTTPHRGTDRAHPTIRACTRRSRAATCWSRSPGLHRNVWVFDFKSLYPSVIRTFNIDPLSYVAQPCDGSEDLIVTPGGALSTRARDPAATCSMSCSRGAKRPSRRRRRCVARHQDSDELVLWRARHAGVPLLQSGARELDHRHRARDAAVVEAMVRGGAASTCSTATRTACSCSQATVDAEAVTCSRARNWRSR